jgi:hypothetical protein
MHNGSPGIARHAAITGTKLPRRAARPAPGSHRAGRVGLGGRRNGLPGVRRLGPHRQIVQSLADVGSTPPAHVVGFAALDGQREGVPRAERTTGGRHSAALVVARGGDIPYQDAPVGAVLLAKQRKRRTTLPLYARFWGLLQDWTVGYGYRPARAGFWLLTLLVAGATVFAVHHPPAVEKGKGPAFNAVMYTLDLLLPLIDFGQEKAFQPSGGGQWVAYGLIVAGWVLATTIAAGITRALSRQ